MMKRQNRPRSATSLGILSFLMVATLHGCGVAAEQWSYRDFFDQIEKTAGLSRFGSEVLPPTLSEIRILNWTPTAMIPMSGLRLVQTGSETRAQLILAWHADVSPNVRRPAPTAQCDRDGPHSACVEVLDLSDSRPPFGSDWTALFGELLAMPSCEDPAGPVTVTTDSGDLAMRIIEGRRSREYYCNAPRGRHTPAGRQAAALLDYLDANLRRALGR